MKSLKMKRIAVTVCSIGISLIVLSSVAAGAAVNPLKQLYDQTIQEISRKHKIDPNLVHAIILAESNYNYRAVSSKGAMGLMQLMPATARIYGVRDPFNFRQNIEGGIKYLKQLIELFPYNKNTRLVLAAYNAGQEAVKKYGDIPPYPETKQYINRVMAAYNRESINGNSVGKVITYYDEEKGVTVMTNFPMQGMVKSSKDD